MRNRINNAASLRHKDENGFLYVEKSPILRTGILEYYGSELLPEGEHEVDGVKVDPDRVYKVFIPLEELEKGKDTFRLIPIVNNHTWLGTDGEDAKEFQEGTTGEGVFIEDGFLYAPLKFTGNEIIKDIESGDKVELSSSYTNRFKRSKSNDFDFIATEIKGNHLALVDRGRCGDKVRILNNEKKENDEMAKVDNEAILKINGKSVDLEKFLTEEKTEKDAKDMPEHEKSITEDEAKEDPAADQEPENADGGELEKIKKVLEDESIADKLAAIKEIISAGAKDVENEDGKCDDKKKEEESKEKEEKIFNSIADSFRKAETERKVVYNAVREFTGDFNAFGMTSKDMLTRVLNSVGIKPEKDAGVAELQAMFNAVRAVRNKVDNGFSYRENSASDEIEINF